MGYLEGERATRMPYGKAIEGLHTFGVEQHGPVADTLAVVRHQLEVGIVGGHHPVGMAAMQFLQHRFGNGTPRARLGATPQLVEQEEGALVGCFQQLFHVLQMRGVGAQVVVYGLLVADVDKDAVEDAKLRCLPTGHQHAALQHVLYQPHRFQAYRFATGIGARHYQDVGLVVQLDVEWHHFFFELEVEQRMTGIEPVDFGYAVHNRSPSVQCECKTGFCPNKVDTRQKPIGIHQCVELRTQPVGELRQYFLYLVSFGKLQLAEVVAQLHHFRRLDVGGLTRG